MQLTFACKVVSIETLLKCSLGLNKTEMLILKTMPGSSEMDIARIVRLIKKDRTVIQRALTGLYAKGLARRRQINLDTGGYYFVYAVVPKVIVKEKIIANFKGFGKSVEDAIERW